MADLPTFLLKILMCVIPIALPKAAGVGREVPSGSSAKSWGVEGSGGQELPHTPKSLCCCSHRACGQILLAVPASFCGVKVNGFLREAVSDTAWF